MSTRLAVAIPDGILVLDPSNGDVRAARLPEGARPTALASNPGTGVGFCSTRGDGVLRTDDGGRTWVPRGLASERLETVAVSPAASDVVWAGAEMSAVWRSGDGGGTWRSTADLKELESSSEWAFPPRPDTHHVRWIACHPEDPDRMWVAIEAGALVSTLDGGASWIDRVPGGPRDTHELAIHPDAPDVLRSAAGDGFYESRDGGATWSSPEEGLEVGYLRSVAIDPGDPELVVVSAAPHAHRAYASGSAEGHVYRREGDGPWERVTDGWPRPARTIAPLLIPGIASGEIWAADERGVHRSADGGGSWRRVAEFDPAPDHLRGLALLSEDGGDTVPGGGIARIDEGTD